MDKPIKIGIQGTGTIDFLSKNDEHFDKLSKRKRKYLKKEFQKRRRIKKNKKIEFKSIASDALFKKIPEDLHSDIIDRALSTEGKNVHPYIIDIKFPNDILLKHWENNEELTYKEFIKYYGFLEDFQKEFSDYISNYYELMPIMDAKKFLVENPEDMLGVLEDLIFETFTYLKIEYKGTIINLNGRLNISKEILSWANNMGYSHFFIIKDVRIGNAILYEIWDDIEGKYHDQTIFAGVSDITVNYGWDEGDRSPSYELIRIDIIH